MPEEIYNWSALTPEERDRAAKELANHVDTIRQRIAETIDDEYCSMIRQWRADHGLSWRAVASLAAETIPDWTYTDQIAGRMLCQHAARHFGEDPDKEPWN